MKCPECQKNVEVNVGETQVCPHCHFPLLATKRIRGGTILITVGGIFFALAIIFLFDFIQAMQKTSDQNIYDFIPLILFLVFLIVCTPLLIFGAMRLINGLRMRRKNNKKDVGE